MASMTLSIKRNIARYRMIAAGVKHINRKGADGRSYFALNWRAWVRVKYRKPSLLQRIKWWWVNLQHCRLLRHANRKIRRELAHREKMIRRDQRFREKHAKERARLQIP